MSVERPGLIDQTQFETRPGVKDLSVTVVDDREIERLKIADLGTWTQLDSFRLLTRLKHKVPHILRLSWSGTLRIPLGFVVNGLEVASGQFGILEAEDGRVICDYWRQVDESGPGVEDPHQVMYLLYKTNE